MIIKQRFLLLPLAVLFSLSGLGGCGGGGAERGEMPPIPVTAAKVTRQDTPRYIDAIGNTAALQSVNIVPQVSGKLQQIHFAQGADVAANDLLFSIDPAPFIAALHDAESKVAKDEAELALAQAQLARSMKLVNGNFVSPQDIDTLKARVLSAQASIKGDKAAVETAKINLNYCSIRSPVKGVAGKYQLDAGNIVSSITGTPLVSVQDIDSLYVDFSVPEKDLIAIQKGLRKSGSLSVQTTSLSDSSVHAKGRLKYVDNQIASGSGTVMLRAVIQNKKRLFWPGQSIKVRVVLSTIKDALLMPFQALQFGQQGSFVFTVKDDSTAEIKVVEPGQRQGDMIVVSKGLSENDTVVLTGLIMLSPGAKVVVLPPSGSLPQSAAGSQQTSPG